MAASTARLHDGASVSIGLHSLSGNVLIEIFKFIFVLYSILEQYLLSMDSQKDYHLGLLYLVHLLISADGVVDESEQRQLLKIRDNENIPAATFDEFSSQVRQKKDRDIYQLGIEYINRCSDEQKLDAFVHLYKMSEADGTVHVKEVRLLLYSIKMASIEFNDVVARAKQS